MFRSFAVLPFAVLVALVAAPAPRLRPRRPAPWTRRCSAS